MTDLADLKPLQPMSVLTVEKLMEHINHHLATAIHGLEWIMNVALVCEDCQEVLADWDRN
jgi:hypothetical protein